MDEGELFQLAAQLAQQNEIDKWHIGKYDFKIGNQGSANNAANSTTFLPLNSIAVLVLTL